jgi:hypothetical protein
LTLSSKVQRWNQGNCAAGQRVTQIDHRNQEPVKEIRRTHQRFSISRQYANFILNLGVPQPFIHPCCHAAFYFTPFCETD